MFVVYNIETTMEAKRSPYLKVARRWANELGPRYAVTDVYSYYDNVVKQVERVNLMSGKTYKEASNTPRHLSPASEAYWSM